MTDVHHEICIGYRPDEPPTLAQISRNVVEHLVYGRLCLERVVRAELHCNDVKRPRERLGREGRSGLDWVVVGGELGEPRVEAVALELVPSVSSLVYGYRCNICVCLKSREEWGERIPHRHRHNPLSALLPIFVGPRPYRGLHPALAPEIRAAGQCPSFGAVHVPQFVDEDGLDPIIEVL